LVAVSAEPARRPEPAKSSEAVPIAPVAIEDAPPRERAHHASPTKHPPSRIVDAALQKELEKRGLTRADLDLLELPEGLAGAALIDAVRSAPLGPKLFDQKLKRIIGLLERSSARLAESELHPFEVRYLELRSEAARSGGGADLAHRITALELELIEAVKGKN
jgi:hypothetical protein